MRSMGNISIQPIPCRMSHGGKNFGWGILLKPYCKRTVVANHGTQTSIKPFSLTDGHTCEA